MAKYLFSCNSRDGGEYARHLIASWPITSDKDALIVSKILKEINETSGKCTYMSTLPFNSAAYLY